MKKRLLPIRWTKAYRAEVVKLYSESGNAGAVATKLGKFRSSVLRVLKQEGVYVKPSGFGPGHSQWKGGRSVHGQSGYWTVYAPNHPRRKPNNRVFEHILVAEKKIGRPISRAEPIHHIDFDPLNNHPDNLYVCRDNKEHMDIHYSLEEIARQLFRDGKLGFLDGKYYWKQTNERTAL